MSWQASLRLSSTSCNRVTATATARHQLLMRTLWGLLMLLRQ
jgi:hypothetical protein